MQISKDGINLIKKYEGLRLKAYKAVETEKYWTIGYGHYGADVSPTMRITEKQAEELLVRDLQRFVDGVNKYVTTKLNQFQFDALVSLAYNCGVGALQKSTLLKYVNERNFPKAQEEFHKWNKSGGKVLKGLIVRRAEEAELFGKEEVKVDVELIREIKRKALAGLPLVNPTPETIKMYEAYRPYPKKG